MARPKGSKDKEPRVRRNPFLAGSSAASGPAAAPPQPGQEPAPLPTVGITAQDTTGPFRRMVLLLADVEDALRQAGTALAPHLQAAQLDQEVRARLIALGAQIVDHHGSGAPLLDGITSERLTEIHHLRLSASAAKEAALAADMLDVPGGETQAFTDRLPS